MVSLLTSLVTTLPAWLRMILAIGFVVGGGLVAYYVSARLGIVMLAFGLVFVIFSEKTRSERGGYNF